MSDETQEQPKPTPSRLPANVARDEITGRFRSLRDDGATEAYDVEGGEALDRMTDGGIEPPPESDVPAQGHVAESIAPVDPPEPARAETPDPGSAEPSEPAPEPAPPEMMTVKVNGRDVVVSREDVDNAGGERAYRTSLAAEERLENAKTIERQNREIQQQLQQRLDQLETADTPSVDLKQVTNDLLYGSEEERLAAVQVIMGQKANPTPGQQMDRDAIADEIAKQAAIQQFERDYPVLWNDEDFRELVFKADDRQLASGDRRPYAERYDEIGRNLMAKVGGTGGTPQPETEPQPVQGDTLEARRERKARAGAPLPSSPPALTQDTPRPPTERDRQRSALSALRKSRHQSM